MMVRKAGPGLLAFVCIALPATAATAAADGAFREPPPAVAQADDPQAEAAERERRVSARTERAKREAMFNQLDQDGDGYLSAAEIREEPALQRAPDVLDRDGDGRISRTEFAAVELELVTSDADP